MKLRRRWACALALLLAVLALSPAAAQAAGLEVSNLTNTSVRLTITNHSGDWSLQQEFGQRICLSLVGVTYVNAKGLQPGTSYTYGAYDGRGCTGSSIASATFTTKAPPPAPSISTVIGDNAKATLTWTSGGDGGSTITKWQYRKADSGNWETNWTDICANTSGCPDKRSHTVANLTNGTEYRFRVRAVNVYGDGAESSPSDAVTPEVKTLTAGNIGATTATLTIAHHTGDWHYQYTSPSGGICSSTAVSGASVDLIDLLTATTYVFSAYSESTCATVIATADAFLTKPGKTTGVTVAAVNSKPKVSWTEVTGAASYKVQWKSGNENWDVSRQTTATATSATLASLNSSTRYTVRVAAVNATGDGAWSDEVQTLVSSPGDVAPVDGTTTPSAPSRLTVLGGDRSATLSWTAGGAGGSAITGWQYRRKAGDGEWGAWTRRAGQRREHDKLQGHGPRQRHGLPVQGASGQRRGRRRGIARVRCGDPGGAHRASQAGRGRGRPGLAGALRPRGGKRGGGK